MALKRLVSGETQRRAAASPRHRIAMRPRRAVRSDMKRAPDCSRVVIASETTSTVFMDTAQRYPWLAPIIDGEQRLDGDSIWRGGRDVPWFAMGFSVQKVRAQHACVPSLRGGGAWAREPGRTGRPSKAPR